MVCKFTKDDRTNLTGVNSTSTPVNNIFHSLFTEINVSLNGKIITPGTDTYPYKAYFEKLLSYEPRTLRTQMKACSLWVKDTAGHMNDLKYDAATQAKIAFAVADDNVNIDATQLALTYPNESQNDGLRHKAIDDSKKIVLMDRLHIDLFQQEKLLPNGIDVRLRFNRAKPQFYMMTAALSSGKVYIQSIVMWVRKNQTYLCHTECHHSALEFRDSQISAKKSRCENLYHCHGVQIKNHRSSVSRTNA